MLDPQKAAKLIREHFAELTTEQFVENLRNSSPKIFEEQKRTSQQNSSKSNSFSETKLKKPIHSMSTKVTVAYGENFHLYQEVFDEDYIYLELEGVKFEASYNRIVMPIPIHIWEVIRKYQGIDLSWASRTDESILQYVEEEVDKRIQKFQQAENQKNQRLIALLGSMPYGSADTSRQQQIEKGIDYFKNLREHQREIKQAIEDLEKTNKNP